MTPATWYRDVTAQGAAVRRYDRASRRFARIHRRALRMGDERAAAAAARISVACDRAAQAELLDPQPTRRAA